MGWLDERQTIPVSVIIPAYNVENTIGETLRSVFSQTVCPLQVIVINDGSTDRTADLARQAGAIVHNQANAGVSAARNAGAELASAPWIAYLDGDDLWAPDKLERQFAALAIDQTCGIVFTDFWQFDNARRINDSVIHEVHNGFVAVEKQMLAPGIWRCESGSLCRLIPRQFVILPSTVLVKRDLVIAVGGWDPQISCSEDIEIELRLLARSTALFVDVPLVGYRRHAGNVTTNRLRMRSGDVDVLHRVLASPSKYLPSTVRWYHKERSIIFLKAGRMAVVYGDTERAFHWLSQSLKEKRRFSAIVWLALSLVSTSAAGRWAMPKIERAWFWFKRYRTRKRQQT